MATTAIKVTYFFRDVASDVDDGWTESFYTGDAAAQIAINRLSTDRNIELRLACLSEDYKLTRLRAVSTANRLDTYTNSLSGTVGLGQAPNPRSATSKSAAPWTGVLIGMNSGVDSYRSFCLHGLPQGVITNASNYAPAPTGIGSNILDWCNALAAGTIGLGAQLRKRVLSLPLALPTAVAINSAGKGLKLTYPTDGAPPTPNPAVPPDPKLYPRLYLKGVTGANNCNGLWRVASNDGTTIVLAPRQTQIWGNPTAPIQLFLVTYNYVGVTGAFPLRGMERKVGRPSIALRGRARRRSN